MTAEDEIVGVLPPPRVLFVYSATSDAATVQGIRTELRDVIPTAEIVQSHLIQSVDLPSFDLAVMFGGYTSVPASMQVILFGGEALGAVEQSGFIKSLALRRDGRSVSTRWTIPVEVTDKERALVEQDLLPLVPRGSSRPPDWTGNTATISVYDQYTPQRWPEDVRRRRLLVDAGEQVFALAFERRQKGPWCWVLPEGSNAARWIRLVLELLNAQDMRTFPLLSSWADRNEYQTRAERMATQELVELAQQRQTFLNELAMREAETQARLAQAREEAEREWRTLVTRQGGELVAAVRHALEELQFVVSDSDSEAQPGQLLEDLQVRLPEAANSPGDVALTEVRGYSGGARVNDLQRIGRFVTRYVQRHQVLPTRRWYVVNEGIGRPPSERRGPLRSNEADLETFAEDGGLVIGTEELLKLVLLVERRELDAVTARGLLWASTGRFTFDAASATGDGKQRVPNREPITPG